ncbi:hypothetical protein SAMN05444274_10357 [Mariniphaga anaerophila]|uniref:Uncharacterized protein n=1 Tax=Mariniphaga anaerophila TaxID=1484053 RepID=A0A1M4XMA8_9BACT|nr:hypothetical protein SAMN05444274_10357 [Mariniphaga anaerophila]
MNFLHSKFTKKMIEIYVSSWMSSNFLNIQRSKNFIQMKVAWKNLAQKDMI